MIFKIISIYFKTKKGIKDPEGFAVEEAQDFVTGTLLIPLVILIGVTILLGILSFTHVITNPSITAQIFFWISIVVTIAYSTLIVFLRILIGKIIKKIHQVTQNYVNY